VLVLGCPEHKQLSVGHISKDVIYFESVCLDTNCDTGCRSSNSNSNGRIAPAPLLPNISSEHLCVSLRYHHRVKDNRLANEPDSPFGVPLRMAGLKHGESTLFLLTPN